MKWMFFIFVGCRAFGQVAAVKALHPTPVTISVIVPCAAQHFGHLEPLLDLYGEQTRAPDEMIVSLSGVERLEAALIDELERVKRPFALKILRHAGRRSAGMNRNLACKAASGSVIVCQDADDVPHPQRIEVVGFLFENFSISHLMHTYFDDKGMGMFRPVEKEALIPLVFLRYDDLERVYRDRLHNGNIAFRKGVSQRVQWDDVFECDHDVKFNRDVYRLYRDCGTIDCDLLLYRQKLSAFNPSNIPWSE